MTDDSNYRWYILVLIGLTATLVIAMPGMAMPVLFSEISSDLGLSLVQVGVVWGAGSLAGLLTVLAGGTIGDRFGTRLVLATSCLVTGVTGALRGLADSFILLVITTLLTGFVSSAIPMILHKACGVWYSGKRLGLANSVVSAGMALGFMSGSLFSATVLSPWLGGWRQVMFVYGGIAVMMSIPWAFSRTPPGEAALSARSSSGVSMGGALAHVVRIRNVWLLGLVLLGVGGCIQGMLGYLPLYLRDVGWAPALADTALASFHATSLAAVFPLAILSDRFRLRVKFLMGATLVIAMGIGLLAIADGAVIWIAVLMAGAFRDGFMAIFMTTVIEQDSVGSRYAGTATGLTMTLSRLGGLIAPPLGNSLAGYNLHLPFVFWACMALLVSGFFFLIKAEKVSVLAPVE